MSSFTTKLLLWRVPATCNHTAFVTPNIHHVVVSGDIDDIDDVDDDQRSDGCVVTFVLSTNTEIRECAVESALWSLGDSNPIIISGIGISSGQLTYRKCITNGTNLRYVSRNVLISN